MAAHVAPAHELGADAGHHTGGSLEWVGGDEHRELRERVERLARRGYPAQWVRREHVANMEPAIAVPDHVREVAFYAADGWLDAPRLIRPLLGAATRLGADIRERAPVLSLRTRDRRVETLVVGDSDVAAETVLICVGPSTEAFLAPLGLRMPIGRLPGLLAVTSPPAQPLQRVVHAPGIHLRPDPSGGLGRGDHAVLAPFRPARLRATS